MCKGKQLSINCKTVSSSQVLWNERHNGGPNWIFIANLILAEGKTLSENPSFFLKRQKEEAVNIFLRNHGQSITNNFMCDASICRKKYWPPTKIKRASSRVPPPQRYTRRHVFFHTNELVTKAKKETRQFTWTWRRMFLLQSLYPLNWLLVCFHSVSFSLLVYLLWVLPQKESAVLYPIYTPFPICSCTEDTAGAFKTPQIGPFTSISLT